MTSKPIEMSDADIEMLKFMGFTCKDCDGRGWYTGRSSYWDHRYKRYYDEEYQVQCERCNCTGVDI